MMTMKMKSIKRYLLTLLVLGVCGVASAQDEGFAKQIEIQKEYEVVVRSAERIESDVRLLDTTIVRPELSFRIRPVAHQTNFATTSLKPLTISTAEWAVPRRLYLNVGGGLPLQSEADLYWAPVDNSTSQLSVWLNHEGSEGKVTNLDGEKLRSVLLRNKAGVNFSTLIGKSTSLSTSISYRGSMGDGSGGVGVVGERPFLSANDIDAKANLSGGFGANSPLGYDLNLMGLYAWNNSEESVWRFNVNYGLLGLNKINRWLPNRVTLHYSGVQSECREPYYDTSITLVPEWSFRVGKWIPVEAMVGYDHMIYEGAQNSLNGVVASIATSFDKYTFAVPYLTLANDVQTQATRNGLWDNPYMAMLPVDSRKVFLAEVGVRGDVGDVTYKLSGASRWFSTYMFEVVVEGSPRLGYGKSNAQRVWYADAEAQWRPSERLNVEAYAHFISLGRAESSTAEYSPRKWTLGAKAEWAPFKRLLLSAGCEWKSAMEVTLVGADFKSSLMSVPAYCDLGVGAEWLWKKNLTLWLRGDNLLNQEIYHWATYRALGAGFRLGAKMTF